MGKHGAEVHVGHQAEPACACVCVCVCVEHRVCAVGVEGVQGCACLCASVLASEGREGWVNAGCAD